MIEIMIKEDGIWLDFVGVNAMISLESLIQKSGPIVAKELRKWATIVRQGVGVKKEKK